MKYTRQPRRIVLGRWLGRTVYLNSTRPAPGWVDSRAAAITFPASKAQRLAWQFNVEARRHGALIEYTTEEA